MEFKSLEKWIAPYAGQPFIELPTDLQEAWTEASHVHWDLLGSGRRISFALRYDEESDPAMLPKKENVEAEAGLHIGYYGDKHIQAWLSIGDVSPLNAALLFFGKNPSKYKSNLPDFGESFDLMKWSFDDAARDGHSRSLNDWLILARSRNLNAVGLDGWEACATIAAPATGSAPAQNTATTAPVVAASDGPAKPQSNKSEKTLIFEARVLELMGKFWNDRTPGTKPKKNALCKLVYGEMLRGDIRGERDLTDGMVRDAAKPWKFPLVIPAFVPDSKFNDKRHPFKGDK